MNERILELAKEAGLSYIPSSNSGPLRVEYLFPELEKFAELIIQECIKIALDHDPLYGASIDEDIKRLLGVE